MKPHSNGHQAAQPIGDIAAEWITTLAEGGARERAQCLAWLKESPDHVREFLLVTALWKGLDDIDATGRIDIDALLATASATVVPLDPIMHSQTGALRNTRAGRNIKRSKWWLTGIAAASVAVALAVGWVVPMLTDTRTYTTATGGQETVTLADGSSIHLNTRTHVDVRLDATVRELRLVEGEALFTVAHDATRPFEVTVGEALVRAVGTQFNIRRDVGETTVSVLEGTVRVSALGNEDSQSHMPNSEGTVQTLTAGEQIRITARVGLDRLARPDVQKAVAWRKRMLIFSGEPLATVATEVNRYNENVRIEVEGKARERQLIGLFAADDPESLVQFLSNQDDVLVERNGAVIRILPREHAPTPVR